MLTPPFLSAPDWHAGGSVENDRDESRSARLLAEFRDDPHHTDCGCQPCRVDRSGLSDPELRGAS